MAFDWTRYQAVLFDLDGVLTSTAIVHASAWKRAFDRALVDLLGPDREPFDIDEDYRLYVDGRPRYEGVATFLRSRGLELPWGAPEDPPGTATVCAVGNMKNRLFNEVLDQDGVDAYPGSIALLDHLQGSGMDMAVVSSSKNAVPVLEAAGIADRFATVVDGIVAGEQGLDGKPAADTFLYAAAQVSVAPSSAVVVEDAVAGVRAGVTGRFGAVIGVDRHSDPQGLVQAGADEVVSDLAELLP